MENINVRSLLIESRIDENFDFQYNRFKSLAKKLTSLKESKNTVSAMLTEESVDSEKMETVNSILKESYEEFVKVRKILSETRSLIDIKSINENLKEVNEAMSVLEENSDIIEESLHDVVDDIEPLLESKKKV